MARLLAAVEAEHAEARSLSQSQFGPPLMTPLRGYTPSRPSDLGPWCEYSYSCDW